MKRLFLGLLITGFLVTFNSKASAWWWQKEKKEAEEQQPVKQEPAIKQEAPKVPEVKHIDRQAQVDQDKKKQILARKLIMLNNTEWGIELAAATGKEKRQVSLIFKDNKVSSTFSSTDFPATNFTPTYNEDGSLLLETMQTGEKQGVLFWRIEVSADMSSLRGLVVHQFPNNTTKDYNFVSSGKVPLNPNKQNVKE